MSVEIDMSKFARAVIRQMKPIIERDLNETREILNEEFNAPKTGLEYRNPQGGLYRASAPGEPPAIRSGDLRDSITEPEIREQGGGLVGEIRIGGQAAPYAIYLEHGNRRGLAPRPYARRAAEELLRRRA